MKNVKFYLSVIKKYLVLSAKRSVKLVFNDCDLQFFSVDFYRRFRCRERAIKIQHSSAPPTVTHFGIPIPASARNFY
ncbi:Uncharacterized protein APZ42_012226 [Daphnia magna]|uniref:Uncharacterized protein n=1 Tax=Daphnia magna TaxID=35525 RepID=A0A162S7S3_9CRUS|nr:Uncharacterized protein APZ42_012226 [Daphnia magna]